MRTSSPFTRPRRQHDPVLRLVVVHHAGGSAATFFPLARALPRTWEPVLYDLPGHGRRRAESPLETVGDMVKHLVADVDDELEAPLALFGHSLGAVVAFEAARALTDQGRPPLWLGLSGRSAPGHRVGEPRAVHSLDDDSLLASLSAVGGGMPERIAEVPEFRDRFLRLVRADLGAVGAYRPDPERTPLPCPVAVYSGTSDPWAPVSGAAAWAHETRAPFSHRTLPGGHFYFLDHGPARLTREMAADLREAVPEPADHM